MIQTSRALLDNLEVIHDKILQVQKAGERTDVEPDGLENMLFCSIRNPFSSTYSGLVVWLANCGLRFDPQFRKV